MTGPPPILTLSPPRPLSLSSRGPSAPADLDRRTEAASGRTAAGAPQGGVDVGAPLGAGLTAGMGQGNTNLESMPGAGAMADDTSTLGTADLRTGEMSTGDQGRSAVDRKSTRLNSSHANISYAVFCLKKKT